MAAPKGNKHGVGHGRPCGYKGEKTDKDVFEFVSKNPVIDRQIAEFLNIDLSTLSKWKHDFPSFSESLNSAKRIIDLRIESALFKRAEGYIGKEVKAFCHEGCIVTKTIEKEFPPDPTSMIFWLKNRQRKEWRDRHDTEVTVKDADKMALPELLAEIEKLKKDLE